MIEPGEALRPQPKAAAKSAGGFTAPGRKRTLSGRKLTAWGKSMIDGQKRSDIRPGMRVEIILKKDQRTGKRTVGTVKDILTSSSFHSRGIKVRLEDGRIGRVQGVLSDA